jgi:ABC-2 type transport system ATP-binding protein
MSAVVATGLSRRYGRRWALQDCCLEIPTGAIAGLVGPNGAGKTTFLNLAAGLLGPTTGEIRVLGRNPRSDASLIRSIGFLPQDVPLYRSFTVAETLHFGARMNPAWDADFASDRIRTLGIPLDQRAGQLSGGQRAQLALVLALGKRPDLLLLDEPLASLDPLARQQFLQLLMESTVETGMTVVLSSHLIVDLERVCDHLILLSASRTQVTGAVDELLGAHRVLTGRRRDVGRMAGVAAVVRQTYTDRQTTLFVRTEGAIVDPEWAVEEVTLEELVLAYLGSPDSVALPGPRLAATPVGGSE